MSDYKHGQMDITTQEKTFAGFMSYVTYGAIISILILVFAYAVNG